MIEKTPEERAALARAIYGGQGTRSRAGEGDIPGWVFAIGYVIAFLGLALWLA